MKKVNHMLNAIGGDAFLELFARVFRTKLPYFSAATAATASSATSATSTLESEPVQQSCHVFQVAHYLYCTESLSIRLRENDPTRCLKKALTRATNFLVGKYQVAEVLHILRQAIFYFLRRPPVADRSEGDACNVDDLSKEGIEEWVSRYKDKPEVAWNPVHEIQEGDPTSRQWRYLVPRLWWFIHPSNRSTGTQRVDY